jgi:hypothetical protein
MNHFIRYGVNAVKLRPQFACPQKYGGIAGARNAVPAELRESSAILPDHLLTKPHPSGIP